MSKHKMTDAEAAEFYHEHRNDPDTWGEEVPVKIARRLDSVISVRFNSAEIARVQKAADAANLSLSAYIRRLVLAAPESRVVDIERARRDMTRVLKDVSDALHALG